jgi:transcriptional regulator with GAF, ATPase, and Fis domain
MPGTGKSLDGAARALPIQPDARFNARTARPSTRPELFVIKELMRRLWEQLELLEPPAESEPTMPLTLRDETHRFEARLITQALARTGGHQFRAARLLGLRPTTLHEKMKRYGITDKHGKSRSAGTTSGGSKR